MTYELKLERVIEAPPDVVFDTIVDPEAQPDLFEGQVPGWGLLESAIDLRVGGTWTTVFGPSDGSGEPDRLTSVFTEIDRPRLLAYRISMYVSEWKRTVDFMETITFEPQGGGTLLTIVQSGYETEADRDAWKEGTPGYIDAIQRVVAARMERERQTKE